MSNETLHLAEALIARPSLTPDDAGCMEIIVGRLARHGFHHVYHDFNDTRNLWIYHGTDGPVFAFLGHTDVVPTGPYENWLTDPFVPEVHEGMLYGRGAADMKGGVAAMVMALERFVKAHPDHPGTVAMLLTSDEEGAATDGVAKVMDTFADQRIAIRWCLVGEPSSFERLGDVVRVGRRGSLNGHLKVLGVQGHVAYPDLADNPVHAFAPAMQALCSEVWDHGNEFFPPTRLQISNIMAGTGAENVIPGQLDVRFNFRFSTAVTMWALQQRVESILIAHGVRFEIGWRLSGAPFLTTEPELLNAVQAALQDELGYQARPDTGGGTSDGRFVAPTGAQVVELGPLNATIHKVNECVPVADLEPLARIYQSVVERLLLEV